MSIPSKILPNINSNDSVRARHSRVHSDNIGAAPVTGWDYLIKQPTNGTTPDIILPVGVWDSVWVQQHSVVTISGTYYHYYHGGPSTAAFQIGLAISTDGVTLTKHASNPIFSTTVSAWDSAGVGDPIVWFENQIWHMLYGGNNGSAYKIGHATSSNGVTWTKDSNNPALVPGSGWDSAFVFPTSIMKRPNGVYYLYYWAGSSLGDQTTWCIGLATAMNPSGPWTKYSANPVFSGVPAAWDAGILDPHILIRDGIWFMLYQGNQSDGAHSRTGLAWSLDGIHWTRSTNNPRMVFRANHFDSEWGGEMPHAVQVGTDWYVYWNGSNGSSPLAQEGYALWLPFNTVLSSLFNNLQASYELSYNAGDASDNGFVGTISGQTGGNGNGPNGVEQVLVFTAINPTSIDCGDHTQLEIGTGDFCVSIWVYVTDKSLLRTAIAKYIPSVGNHEWFITYNAVADRYRFGVSTDGSLDSTVDAASYGSPPTSTWAHILAWVDRTSNTINICVNNGTVDSASLTFTAQATASALTIGVFPTGVFGWEGRLCKAMIFKSATAGGAIPTTAQRTWLYNSGNGRTYKDLPTAP